LADTRLPATHRAGRVAILLAVALLVLSFSLSGAALGVVHWGARCGGDTIAFLLSPLLDDNGGVARPDPGVACFHGDSGPAEA
jgi:hypothetical protein